MAEQLSVSPVRSPRELDALMDVLAPTFNFTRDAAAAYTRIVGRKNYWVVREGSTVLGGCALLPLGQFFGGRSVRMCGVAAVGIAPEHRGGDVGGALMRGCVRHMHASGRFAISALYPATLPLYRRVGYESAGKRYEVRIPAKALTLPSSHRDDTLAMRRFKAADLPVVKRLQRNAAALHDGHLDRSDFNWHRVQHPRGQDTLGFIIENQTRAIEGYAFYLQKETPEAPYSLHVTDALTSTPAAGRRLLRFFATHRSMTHEIVLARSPDDPLIKLLPERSYKAALLDHWMVRIVDVGAALSARGYARGLDVEVHLDVEDDLLVTNNGRYVLRLRNGRARVDTGGRGDIRIDVRGLAALYTGHMSPHDLLLTGQLAPKLRLKRLERILDDAQAAFAGPDPWMSEMF